jgi:hypothetical protein
MFSRRALLMTLFSVTANNVMAQTKPAGFKLNGPLTASDEDWAQGCASIGQHIGICVDTEGAMYPKLLDLRDQWVSISVLPE